MKHVVLLLVILINPYRSFSQDCMHSNYITAQSILIKIIGSDNYVLKDRGDKLLSFAFVCDTLGNVLSIGNSKIFDKKLSKRQFNSFCKKFKETKMSICNPEPEINKIDYLRMKNFKPQYYLLLKVN